MRTNQNAAWWWTEELASILVQTWGNWTRESITNKSRVHKTRDYVKLTALAYEVWTQQDRQTKLAHTINIYHIPSSNYFCDDRWSVTVRHKHRRYEANQPHSHLLETIPNYEVNFLKKIKLAITQVPNLSKQLQNTDHIIKAEWSLFPNGVEIRILNY
jgi:hypothetical protein